MNTKATDSNSTLFTKEEISPNGDNKVFISHEIEANDCFDFQDLDRYEFISKIKKGLIGPKDYGFNDESKFIEWADNNIGIYEIYEIPESATLYYFPIGYSFTEKDMYKCAANTTLLYDRKHKQWAVGQLIEDEDCKSNLLDTFIKLGKGVPLEIV